MTNSIDVCIYSYKGKILDDVVKNLLNNYDNVYITIFDQSPLLKERLQNLKNIDYKHIFWDVIQSPFVYVADFIKQSKSEYLLIMDDNIIMSQNWQELLINNIENGFVLSGNNNIKLFNDNLFYLNREFTTSHGFELNNFIDQSFIFGKTKTLQNIQYPIYLKHNGLSEVLSLMLLDNNLNIYSCPTTTYNKIGENTINTLYTPFSINHNYNEAVNLMHNGFNSFHKLKDKELINKFEDFHKIDFKKINKLPFLTNDVEYDPYSLYFQNVDSKKFIDRTRVIS